MLPLKIYCRFRKTKQLNCRHCLLLLQLFLFWCMLQYEVFNTEFLNSEQRQQAHLFVYRTFNFFFTLGLKYRNKQHSLCILYQNFNSFYFRIWVAVGVVGVHAGFSAVSDCAMVRKVKVTNGMQELRTEEDSLELRQVGSW